MSNYVVAIDQGTTSSRAIIFDRQARIVSVGQKEHEQIFPQAGWVEHDAAEIWRNIGEVVGMALGKVHLTRHEIATIGITNQRETTVIWNRHTGEPIANAIVWQDTRTQDIVDRIADGDPDRFKAITGLPLTTYFSASKIVWLLENVPGARAAAEAGDLLFGTMDTWLLWNGTGGVNGGVHATDVTNASRTLLMDLQTLQWSDELLAAFDIPRSLLPEIRPSSGHFGVAAPESLLREVPITGILGDQQAATFGQTAFDVGDSKNTYGTGGFVIVNTGTDILHSKNGLLTTVGYQLGDEPAHYALEGSVAVAGSLIQWLRDNLGIIESAPEATALAKQVPDNGGVYFVPAFSGLFAPYWRSDARGALVGMTRFVDKRHIARAAIEAIAFQTADVIAAVNADTGVELSSLHVDGGASGNDLLLQFQADLLRIPVIRPQVIETTALGAAFAAGLAAEVWGSLDELRSTWHEDQRWEATMPLAERDRLMRQWHKAVTKAMDWVDDDTQ